jgi:ubiquinone/menaquinone biosynthesis C-methylase UbiE
VMKMAIQKRIEEYWSGAADRYSESIQDELSSFKKDAWLNLIHEYAPKKEKLDVLDIGTGPGFFSIILSMAGHIVIGIDCTEDMLACARGNAAEQGVNPYFVNMDSHKLLFDDDTFDLILCRNLTWILKEPEAAYREWLRVLRPGGVLLVFDANWNLWLFDADMRIKREEDKQIIKKLELKDPHEDANMEESDAISTDLPLSKEFRPQWDMTALEDCGFKEIFVEFDITDKIWDETEKILYRATPMFLVGGKKK